MSLIDKLDRFHQTKRGYTVFAVVELVLAYVFISWAIDSGNWIDYILALIFTVGFLQNIVKLIGKFMADRKHYNRIHRR